MTPWVRRPPLPPPWRDYALEDEAMPSSAAPRWFSPGIDRLKYKLLVKRSNTRALRYFLLWLSLLVASGIGAYVTWGTAWCIPLFAIYGVLYSAADHRHHELSHGTPFKSRWCNEMFFHLFAQALTAVPPHYQVA